MYASDRLASREFKLMTLAERGLLHSCELECWMNGNVPADVGDLARTLGLQVEEVQAAFTERVLARFRRAEGMLTCPDLEGYRARLDEHHRRKSEGGKKGADIRWRHGTPDSSPNASPNGIPNGSLKGDEMQGKERQGQPSGRTDDLEAHRSWIADYEQVKHRETAGGALKR